jgi:histidyl-tRNA synthetase
VAVAKPERRADAFAVVRDLRDAGVAADMEHTERSLKGQLKQADRLGAHYTVILGDTTEVKDMRSGEQREVSDVLQAVGVS